MTAIEHFILFVKRIGMVTKLSLLEELLTTRDKPFMISSIIESWKMQLPEDFRGTNVIVLGLDGWSLEESILKPEENLMVLYTAFGNTEFYLHIPLESIISINVINHFTISFDQEALVSAVLNEADLVKDILSKGENKESKGSESSTEKVGKLEEVILESTDLTDFMKTNAEGIKHSMSKLRLCKPGDTEPSVS